LQKETIVWSAKFEVSKGELRPIQTMVALLDVSGNEEVQIAHTFINIGDHFGSVYQDGAISKWAWKNGDVEDLEILKVKFSCNI
jgi:hypothetical protein